MNDTDPMSKNNTENEKNATLEHTMGVLNIALGIVLLLDTIIIAVIALCCLLLSFSLFFMAAIPAFLLTVTLGIIVFGTAVANIVAGVGTVIASNRSDKILKLFPIATIVIDSVVICANAVAFVCGIYLLATEVNFLSILIFIFAVSAIVLAAVSLILSVIRFAKRKNRVSDI